MSKCLLGSSELMFNLGGDELTPLPMLDDKVAKIVIIRIKRQF